MFYYKDDDKDDLMGSKDDFIFAEDQKEIIQKHCIQFKLNNKNRVHSVWDSLERLYREWCKLGFSKEQVQKVIEDGKLNGEFLFLDCGRIVQFY